MITRKMYNALHELALADMKETWMHQVPIRWNTALALERKGYVGIEGHAYDAKPENEAMNWLMCYLLDRPH